MARQRDYKAEYQARIQRAKTRGHSVSQARGHARASKGEIPISVVENARKGKPSRVFRAADGWQREEWAKQLHDLTGKRVHEIWAQLLGSP